MDVKLSDFPVILLFVGLLYEIANGTFRRMPRMLTWFVRPWVAWAAFNLIFRLRWDQGFNDRLTFPFFANVWFEGETWAASLARFDAHHTFGVWTLVVAAVSALAIFVAHRCARASPDQPRARWLAAIFALAVLLPATFTLIPHGAREIETNIKGPLAPWFKSGGTMLFCMPFIKSVDEYLRNFEMIQPRLEISVHGKSHPPLASLSLRWIGHLTGARGLWSTLTEDRWRYALGLTLISALSVLAIYALGMALFSNRRIALIAAILWMAKPAALAHNTFAQDGVYTIFFICALALTWRVVISESIRWLALLALGVCFAVLTQLTFSWCIVTAIFAAFAFVEGRRRGWKRKDWALRVVFPLAVMTASSVGFCVYYGFDYFEIYQTASAYVAGFYLFEDAYHWIMALVGGQMAILLMMGAIVASGFCVETLPRWIAGFRESRHVFGWIVIVCYMLPILFGPGCLKMETERCWSWVTSIPIVFVASAIATRPDAPRVLSWIVAANLVQYFAMRLYICILS